jgi:hypothetical protein
MATEEVRRKEAACCEARAAVVNDPPPGEGTARGTRASFCDRVSVPSVSASMTAAVLELARPRRVRTRETRSCLNWHRRQTLPTVPTLPSSRMVVVFGFGVDRATGRKYSASYDKARRHVRYGAAGPGVAALRIAALCRAVRCRLELFCSGSEAQNFEAQQQSMELAVAFPACQAPAPLLRAPENKGQRVTAQGGLWYVPHLPSSSQVRSCATSLAGEGQSKSQGQEHSMSPHLQYPNPEEAVLPLHLILTFLGG